jgi:hypothetical protein
MAVTPKFLSKDFFRLMLHPTPEVARLDTSLRYTDILFGFVIREIFLRLQYWQQLPRHVLMHLAVCAALVLGSWIGYRRSLNRSQYEVKFFNLPFFRFLLDQGMLIFYFQMAGSTSVDLGKPRMDLNAQPPVAPDPLQLANGTIKLILLIFVFYLAWDFLGILMARTKDSEQKFRYKPVDTNNNIDTANAPEQDWIAPLITSAGFVLFAFLWLLLNQNCSLHLSPIPVLIIAIVLLLFYRLAKETKTSFKKKKKP